MKRKPKLHPGHNPPLEPRDQAVLDLIKPFGYKDWEVYSVYDSFQSYQVVHARKLAGKPGTGFTPGFHFSWRWDNDGGPEYWIAELEIHFNPCPAYKWRHPHFHFEVNTIMDSSIHMLPFFEKQLLKAIKQQITFNKAGLKIRPKYHPRLPQ